MGPRAVVAHCPSCRAPLQWLGKAEVVECRYCSAHVYVGEKRKDRPDTGTITNLPATRRTLVKPARMIVGHMVTWLVVTLMVAGIGWFVQQRIMNAASSALSQGAARSVSASGSSEEKPRLSLEQAVALRADQRVAGLLEAVGEAIAHTPSAEGYQGVNVRVDAMWDTWRFEWNSPQDPEAIRVSLSASGDVPAAVGDRMVKQLAGVLGYPPRSQSVANDNVGIRLAHGGQFELSASGKTVQWRLGTPAKGKKKRAALLQSLLTQLVTGEAAKALTPEERLQMGLGVRIETLAAANLAIRSGELIKTYASWIPGTVQSRPTYYQVAVDHPWFRSVDFYVQNTPDGGIESIHFRLRKHGKDPARQKRLKACLVPALGEPKTSERKTLTETTFSHTWRKGRGRLYLDATSPHVSMLRGSSAKKLQAWQPTWVAIVKAIGNCRPATP